MHMPQTILYGALETELAGASADRDRLWIPLDELERSTGWTAKPEGLCRDEVCVPVPAARQAEWFERSEMGGGDPDGSAGGAGGKAPRGIDAGRLDFAAFAAHLGHAIARDEDRGIWSFGPPADRGAASGGGPVMAPDVRLPDLDGALHSLSDYRGKKVLLYCWSSW
jgi:hypothetical protein